MTPEQARQLLGIPDGASPEQIRAAWLDRSRRTRNLQDYPRLRDASTVLLGKPPTPDFSWRSVDVAPWRGIVIGLDVPHVALQAAHVAYERGGFEELARAMIRWAPIVARNGDAPRTPVGVHARVALQLFCRGEHELGFALLDAGRLLLLDVGREHEDLADFFLAEELARPGTAIDAEVREVIAAGLLTDDHARTNQLLRQFEARRPKEALASLQALQRQTDRTVLLSRYRAALTAPTRLSDLIAPESRAEVALVAMSAPGAGAAIASWYLGWSFTWLAAALTATCAALVVNGAVRLVVSRARREQYQPGVVSLLLAFIAVICVRTVIQNDTLAHDQLMTSLHASTEYDLLNAKMSRRDRAAWGVAELQTESEGSGPLAVAADSGLQTCAILRTYWLPGCAEVARTVRRARAGDCVSATPAIAMQLFPFPGDVAQQIGYNDQRFVGALQALCAEAGKR